MDIAIQSPTVWDRIRAAAHTNVGELTLTSSEVRKLAEYAPGPLHADPDYTSRRGFDPDFLGTHLPLPTLDARIAADLAVGPGAVDELLHYHHSTTVMHAREHR
jgi:hypothetical protein